MCVINKVNSIECLHPQILVVYRKFASLYNIIKVKYDSKQTKS
jgi:hypothetical protein